MNTVWVNARFSGRRITGVERYATEITRRLRENFHLVAPPRSLRGPAGHMWEQVTLPQRLDREQLLWSPANTGPLGVENQVVTIHDLSVLDHPEWYAPGFAAWYAYLLPRLAHQVRRVVAVSTYTRQAILERFQLPDEKVVCAPAGVDLDRFRPAQPRQVERTLKKYNLPSRFFLTVGTHSRRKNLAKLLTAWKVVHASHAELQLVIVGGSSSAFRNAGLDPFSPGVRVLGYIPDEDLPLLYGGALCLVAPSLYEGFCLPAVEAMACGTPVIASNTTALPETLGGAGWLVDPEDVEDIAAAMLSLSENPDARQRQSERGLDRARRLTFDVSAERLWNVLLESR